MRLVRLLAVASALAGWLSGCFYVDPINRRPRITSLERQCDAAAADPSCDFDFKNFADVHRNETIDLKASIFDPEGHEAESVYSWRIFACNRAGSQCDKTYLYVGEDVSPSFMTVKPGNPNDAQDGIDNPVAVEMVRIQLDLRDDRGALASAFREIVIDDGPTLSLRSVAGTYPIGASIPLVATYGDADDALTDVPLDWIVFSPHGQATYTLIDGTVITDAGDPHRATATKTLVPHEQGAWSVHARVRDPRGQMVERSLDFTVGDDAPPCLAQWQPIVPPAGARLPVSAPTRFAVPVVTDDLDPYPPVVGDPLLGTTAFAWSIVPPGATARQPLLGATGNSVELDPAAFAPGDVVELRVEIADRGHPSVACPDDQPTCAVGGAACLQRQTWELEIR